jgi:hypothetical protein
LKKIIRKKIEKSQNFEKFFLMIWSVVHLAITSGHFGAFIMPLRPHKASDQYPLKIGFHRSIPFGSCYTCISNER